MNSFIQYLKYTGLATGIIAGIILFIATGIVAFRYPILWVVFVLEISSVIGFILMCLDGDNYDALFPYKEYNFKKRNKGDKKDEKKYN
jgi:hypothetical protein